MRLSLRNLLLLTAGFSLAVISLAYANPTWWLILSSVGLLAVLAVAVLAVVARGQLQAIALGAIVCVVGYGGLLMFSGLSGELDPYAGSLPTTRLAALAFQRLVTVQWLDAQGNPVPKPSGVQAVSGSGGLAWTQAPGPQTMLSTGGGGFGGGFGGFGGVVRETPARSEFMRIGHLLWAVLLGGLGALLARAVHRRRPTPTPVPSGETI